jgi:hypothetical protein
MSSWRWDHRSGVRAGAIVAGFVAGAIVAFPTGCSVASCVAGSHCRAHWCENVFGWITSGWNLTFPILGALVLGAFAWLLTREPRTRRA